MNLDGRSQTIWMLLTGLTVISLVAMSFKIYPMTKKWQEVKAAAEEIQFGTDKKLEEVIEYLEKRLEDRVRYQFAMERVPFRLSNVLFLTDGSGRRLRSGTSSIRVAMIYQGDDQFQAQIDHRGNVTTVKKNDVIPDIGHVVLIDQNQVVIQTENKLTSYPAPGQERTKPKEISGQDIVNGSF